MSVFSIGRPSRSDDRKSPPSGGSRRAFGGRKGCGARQPGQHRTEAPIWRSLKGMAIIRQLARCAGHHHCAQRRRRRGSGQQISRLEGTMGTVNCRVRSRAALGPKAAAAIDRRVPGDLGRASGRRGFWQPDLQPDGPLYPDRHAPHDGCLSATRVHRDAGPHLHPVRISARGAAHLYRRAQLAGCYRADLMGLFDRQLDRSSGSGRYEVLALETRGLRARASSRGAASRSITTIRPSFMNGSRSTARMRNVLHDEITIVDHALTHPWTVTRSYRRLPNPTWIEDVCAENNN